MVLQYLTMFSSTSPFSSLTCGGIHTKKEKAEKVFFYGTTFKKNESGRDFQRGQIWNDRSQKQKKESRQSPSLPSVSVGTIPRNTNRIPTENTKSV